MSLECLDSSTEFSSNAKERLISLGINPHKWTNHTQTCDVSDANMSDLQPSAIQSVQQTEKPNKKANIEVIVVNSSGIVQIGSNNTMWTYSSSKKGRDKARKTVHLKVTKRPINNDDIDKMAQRLGKDWRHLGMKLGFLKGELDAFEYDYQKASLHEIIFNMLLAWQEKEGPDAKIKFVVEKLLVIKRPDVADLLK